jgi:uncharacterized membrane protein YtjA (UPF0391 family)
MLMQYALLFLALAFLAAAVAFGGFAIMFQIVAKIMFCVCLVAFAGLVAANFSRKA